MLLCESLNSRRGASIVLRYGETTCCRFPLTDFIIAGRQLHQPSTTTEYCDSTLIFHEAAFTLVPSKNSRVVVLIT